MIRISGNRPLLGIVAAAALMSGGALIWLATSGGNDAADGTEESTSTTTETVAEAQPSTSDITEDTGESDESLLPWPEDASQSSADALRDGVNPVLARLTFADRVDSVASVNASGRRWILSELPTDTRNRLVDERAAGPDLDPFGGEILLVEDEVIVRAYPMNEFPPTFLEANGVMVFGGRDGDGGYPDSALVAINSLTLEVSRIAFQPPGISSGSVYGPEWETGSDQQLLHMAEGNYLSALRALAGILAEGDEWVVRDDPAAGLCAAIADINYGCDVNLFAGPVDPPFTPRIVARPVPAEGIDHDAIGVLIYGYLPDQATSVEIRINGEAIEEESFVDPVLGLWVAPAVVPNEPFSVAFFDESANLIVEWTDE